MVGEKVEQAIRLSSFPAEDGHIESVLIGVQEVKVSFQEWRGKKLVILFHGVEEFHGFDSREQSILNQDIGTFVINKIDDQFNEYCFVGEWDENTFLKIKGKSMDIYEVGTTKGLNTALFEIDLSFIGDQLPKIE